MTPFIPAEWLPVVFAALMACFHLANAAMLPSVGQLLTRVVGQDYATSLIAGCIVAAQCVMVPVAMLAGAKADAWGRKPLFLVAFGVLALAVTAAVLGVLTWYSWLYLQREMPNLTPMLGISAGWAIAPLFVGSLLSLLHLLRNLIDEGVTGALWSDITTRE